MNKILILILLLLLSITSAFAQQRRYNSVTHSFETVTTTEQQPQVVVTPVSKKQVIISITTTAGIAICEQYRKCSNVLNAIRNILVPYQSNPAPVQYFNRVNKSSVSPTSYRQRRNYGFSF
jgi:hypothetical protein